MAQFLVFYSWQSDLPNSTNRNFIEDALNKATKAIKKDDEFLVEPVVDRDTSGTSGAPNIAETILSKIEQAQVFVCDISIINPQYGGETRLTPNPNVLFELGYAYQLLGEERIILIMNTAFGGPDALPFDLKMNRVVTYHLPDRDELKVRSTVLAKLFNRKFSDESIEKGETKKRLVGTLRTALETIISEQGVRNMGGYLLADQKLFARIREILPANGSIRDMREHDYGGAFPRDLHDDIMAFEREFKYSTPENDFFDEELENSKKVLIQKIDQFLRAIGKYTFVYSHDPDWARISVITDIEVQRKIARVTESEEEFNNRLGEHEQRSFQIRDEINVLAQGVCDSYDEFVRLGRNNLAV